MPVRGTKFYRQNESEVMQKLGLIPTKNSGAGWVEKEDGYNEFILSQLKSTDAESIKINKIDIEKLEYHSAVEHKIPVFVIQFIKNNDVFILARPGDLEEIATYLDTGKCNIKDIPELEDIKQKEVKIISSKLTNKKKFWEEKQKEWGKRK